MMEPNTLVLLRGCPGAGTSSFARFLSGGFYLEAKAYFDLFCEGVSSPEHERDAEDWCYQSVERMMDSNQPEIYVVGTFATAKEMQRYFDLAEREAYQVVTLVVENRHGGVGSSPVEEETKKNFEIVL